MLYGFTTDSRGEDVPGNPNAAYLPEVSPRAESYYPIELFETMGLNMVNAHSDHHHHTPSRSRHAPTFLQMFGMSGAEGVQRTHFGDPQGRESGPRAQGGQSITGTRFARM